MAIVGYNYAPVIQAAIQLDRARLLSDGVSLVGSGKTVSDHALSMVTGEECRMLNVVTPNPVCTPKVDAATAKPAISATAAAATSPPAVPETAETGPAGRAPGLVVVQD